MKYQFIFPLPLKIHSIENKILILIETSNFFSSPPSELNKYSLDFVLSLSFRDFVPLNWLAADIWRIADGPVLPLCWRTLILLRAYKSQPLLSLSLSFSFFFILSFSLSFSSFSFSIRSFRIPRIFSVSLLSTRKSNVVFSSDNPS